MRRALIVAGLLALLTTVTAAIAQQTPLDLANPSGGGQYDRVLEKYNVYPQPTDPSQLVVNPGGYGTWDINDHLAFQSYGYLDPGASTSTTRQMVWGYDPMYVSINGQLAWWSSPSPWYGADVTSSSPRLTVRVCYRPQARCFTLAPTQVDTHAYDYKICGQVVYDPDDPALVLIPGSTPDPLPYGSAPGEGVPSTVTVRVSNPTAHRIRSITAAFGVSSDAVFSSGCTEQHGAEQSSYPMTWYP